MFIKAGIREFLEVYLNRKLSPEETGVREKEDEFHYWKHQPLKLNRNHVIQPPNRVWERCGWTDVSFQIRIFGEAARNDKYF